jgi:hypothetical protein
MNTQNNQENFILSLFDWRISKLLALQYFKALYLISLIGITLSLGWTEFYIGKYLDVPFLIKLVFGALTIICGLGLVLINRVIFEFYFAFFYIEKHLRELDSKA